MTDIPTCPTRPLTDNSNACANTAWVRSFMSSVYTIPAPTLVARGGIYLSSGAAGSFVNGVDSSGNLTYGVVPYAGVFASVTQQPPAGLWALPNNFNDQITNSSVSYDGITWRFSSSRYDAIDFTKWTTATNYYVSYATGSNANSGLSAVLAVKTWDYLCTLVAALPAGSAVILNCLDDTIGYLSRTTLISSAFDGYYVKVVSASASGRTKFLVMREDKTKAVFAWVAHGTNGAWKSNVAGAAGNYTGQFFTGQLDSLGLPTPIVSTGQSAATVDTTELTSYWDGTYLYVHLPHGLQPDPFNNWIYNSNNGGHEFQMDTGTLLFENCSFMGGANGVAKNAFRFRPKNAPGDPSTASIGFKNCKFYGASGNGLGVYDPKILVTQDCVSGYNFNDLFNVHSFNSTVAKGTGITYYEENARGHDCGYQGFAYGLAASGSDNVSTVHDGASVVRAGSSGWNCRDCAFVDVGGTDSINFGIRSPKNNRGTLGAYPSSISYEANTGEGINQRMILVGCSGDDLTTNTYAIGNTGTSVSARIYVAYWVGATNPALKAGFGQFLNYNTNAVLYVGPP